MFTLFSLSLSSDAKAITSPPKLPSPETVNLLVLGLNCNPASLRRVASPDVAAWKATRWLLLLLFAVVVTVAALPVVSWLPVWFTPGRLILAEPLKDTPPIVLAVCNIVAEDALPTTPPDAVIAPVKVEIPATSKVDVRDREPVISAPSVCAWTLVVPLPSTSFVWSIPVSAEPSP